MPRLSNQKYLDRCSFLRTAWLEFNQLYSILPMRPQWDLHDFYKPACEWTDDQRLAHRRTVTDQRPALSATSGKAFALMYQAFRAAYQSAPGDDLEFTRATNDFARAQSTPNHARPKGRPPRILLVRAVVNPEIDLHRLSLALIQMAREEIAAERNQKT